MSDVKSPKHRRFDHWKLQGSSGGVKVRKSKREKEASERRFVSGRR